MFGLKVAGQVLIPYVGWLYRCCHMVGQYEKNMPKGTGVNSCTEWQGTGLGSSWAAVWGEGC